MAIFKGGRVCVILRGKYAGKKAIIVKAFEEGSDKHQFPHAVVAGIAKNPRAVKTSMGSKKIARRSKVIPFVKRINLNHVMPTRYQVEYDMKKLVNSRALNPEGRSFTKKNLKKFFSEGYTKQTKAKNAKRAAAQQYFFQKLSF